MLELTDHRQAAGQEAVSTPQSPAARFVARRARRCLSEASVPNALEAMIWQVHIVEAHWLLRGVADWLGR